MVRARQRFVCERLGPLLEPLGRKASLVAVLSRGQKVLSHLQCLRLPAFRYWLANRRLKRCAERRQLIDFGLSRLWRIDECLLIARAAQIAGERVVIASRNGVELMVVAAGAGDGLPQKRFAYTIELIVDAVGLVLANIDRRLLPFVHPPEAGRQD